MHILFVLSHQQSNQHPHDQPVNWADQTLETTTYRNQCDPSEPGNPSQYWVLHDHDSRAIPTHDLAILTQSQQGSANDLQTLGEVKFR